MIALFNIPGMLIDRTKPTGVANDLCIGKVGWSESSTLFFEVITYRYPRQE